MFLSPMRVCSTRKQSLSIDDPTKKTTLADVDGEDLADAFLCSNVWKEQTWTDV